MKKIILGLLAGACMGAVEGAQQQLSDVDVQYQGKAKKVYFFIQDNKGYAVGFEGGTLRSGQKITKKHIDNIECCFAADTANHDATRSVMNFSDQDRKTLKAAGAYILIQDNEATKKLKFSIAKG